MLPLVSIGMPVFNGERYLRGALDSLVAQTYRPIEIVISDNCSSDGTDEICREFCWRYPYIRYHCNEWNIGATANFQHLVELARGEFFMWASHDDLWEPTFIEEIMCGLLSDAKYVTGFCQLDKCNRDDASIVQALRQPPTFTASTTQNQLIYLQHPCPFMVYGLHRIKALRRAINFPPYGILLEYKTPFLLLQKGLPFIVRKVLFHNGRHNERGSKQLSRDDLALAWWRLVASLSPRILFHTSATMFERAAMLEALLDVRRRLKLTPKKRAYFRRKLRRLNETLPPP